MLFKKLIPLILLALFTAINTAAQQGNTWYFGLKAGLSFNTSPPTVLTDSKMNTGEGCATMSDHNAQLLFYTDGVKIWNRLHQVMPNGTGLKGDPSSSNSAIVIPKPGSNHIFFIFTAAAFENNSEGYFYSELDMSLNAGLGDITGTKNVFLHGLSSEKLTATRHSNGIDVWVITKKLRTNEWYVYKVDCNGVNTTPVISAAGVPPEPTSLWNGVGCIKTSPDGRKLANARINQNMWEIFDFNASTGVISNGLNFPIHEPYGVEFSPDSKLVYVGRELTGPISQHGDVFQYNLATYDSAAIKSTETVIGTGLMNAGIGALQLGPDNKIYCAQGGASKLSVIHLPNTPAIACNFEAGAIDLQGRDPQRSLPTFFPGLITNQNASFTWTLNADCATVDFSASSSITGSLTWEWDFGDGNIATGQQVTHTYPSGSTTIFPVKLTVTAAAQCGGTAIAVQQVNLRPQTPATRFDFTRSCVNPSVTFSDLTTVTGTTIQSWEWDFGDGQTSTNQNPVHNYAQYGTYTVTLKATSANNCNSSATEQKTIIIEPKPTAGFTHTRTCVNKLITFSDASIISYGNITRWYWSFGDGGSSTVRNPQKIYGLPGTYTVKLVVASATGCVSDTMSSIIEVTTVPVAGFTNTNGCANQIINFADASTITSGTITRWHWNFGDGNNASVQTPSKAYSQYGQYTVKQVVESAGGCLSDTTTRIIQVDSKPTADFTSIVTCGNPEVSFAGQATNSWGNITQWYWSFGDQSTASLQTPAHTYETFNNYTVLFAAITANGCSSDTISRSIETIAKPVAGFSVTNACASRLTSFTDRSQIAANNIIKWHWITGNQTTPTIQHPQIVYDHAGDYEVKLAVASDKGCSSDTISRIIQVEDIPVANMEASNGCEQQNTRFTDQSSIGTGTITNWYWNYGNGIETTQSSPVYTYQKAGNYSVQLAVASKNGCLSDTVTQTIVIESIPAATFDHTAACPGKAILFTNGSSVAFGNIAGYNWNFGDGINSTEIHPTHTYNKDGNYTASLTAFTVNGCKASFTKPFHIAPVFAFAGNDTIVARHQPVQLYGIGGKHYQWQPALFLNKDTIPNPIAILDRDQTYQLTVTTEEGCIGFDNIKIRVITGPDVYVPNAFTPDGNNRVFRPILAGIQELYYFSVYNRWGQLTFTTKEHGKGWDGKINGIAQPAGPFVWVLSARDYQGRMINKKGNVFLIR